MTHRVITHDDLQKLEFRVKVRHGDDATVDENINLGEHTIKTTSADVAVEFTCMYAMDVTVSSDKYTLNDVAASGVTSSTGSLSDGFQFTVTSPDDFTLGSVINVAATWEVNLPRLSYYFEQCEVQQDTESVVLIKDACISEALSVGELNMTGATLSFNYKSFTIDGATSNFQVLVCKIRICFDECDLDSSKIQCPNTGNDALYMYVHAAEFSDCKN